LSTANQVLLTQRLVKAANTTESLQIISDVLTSIGFTCDILEFGGIMNLVAKKRTTKSKKTLAFIGHVDVVPLGKASLWTHEQGEIGKILAAELKPSDQANPDGGKVNSAETPNEEQDEAVYGRGAADMKGGIACFLEAMLRTRDLPQNVFAIITSDEEGAAHYGTRAVVEHLMDEKKWPNIFFALVGEPVSLATPGDHIKIGGRGSLNVTVVASGKAGHVAYSDHAINPIHALLALLQETLELRSKAIIDATDIYGPTDIEITSIDTANKATNMIPGVTVAKFSVRFNDDWTAEELIDALEQIFVSTDVKYRILYDLACEPFLSDISHGFDMLVDACLKTTGIKPLVSARGANSDARFLSGICPFAEVGLLAAQAHAINECAGLRDLKIFTEIFCDFMQRAARAYWGSS
jgi:succinyl-diaminopimelate desuccinylase